LFVFIVGELEKQEEGNHFFESAAGRAWLRECQRVIDVIQVC
jgi:hypothetical protein